MQKDQQTFITNSSPSITIKLISAGTGNSLGCIKQHIIEVANFQESSLFQSAKSKSHTIVQQNNWIFSMAVSPDTQSLFIVSDNGDIYHYQLDETFLTYNLVRCLKGHTARIKCIALSNSKMHLLSASHDETLRVWDVSNGSELACLNKNKEYHNFFVNSCCLSSDDAIFASGEHGGGEVVIWAPPLSRFNSTKQFMALLKFEIQGEESWIECLKFDTHGYNLFASYTDYQQGPIRLWEITEEMLFAVNDNSVLQNVIKMWRKIIGKQILKKIKKPKIVTEKFCGIKKQFDVRRDIIVLQDGQSIYSKLLMLSTTTLKLLKICASASDSGNNYIDTSVASCIAISVHGSYVALGLMSGQVMLFDINIGKFVFSNYAHSADVKAILFNS